MTILMFIMPFTLTPSTPNTTLTQMNTCIVIRRTNMKALKQYRAVRRLKVFWDETLCCSVEGTKVSEQPAASIFREVVVLP
jgi:hypothetical protein